MRDLSTSEGDQGSKQQQKITVKEIHLSIDAQIHVIHSNFSSLFQSLNNYKGELHFSC